MYTCIYIQEEGITFELPEKYTVILTHLHDFKVSDFQLYIHFILIELFHIFFRNDFCEFFTSDQVF